MLRLVLLGNEIMNISTVRLTRATVISGEWPDGAHLCPAGAVPEAYGVVFGQESLDGGRDGCGCVLLRRPERDVEGPGPVGRLKGEANQHRRARVVAAAQGPSQKPPNEPLQHTVGRWVGRPVEEAHLHGFRCRAPGPRFGGLPLVQLHVGVQLLISGGSLIFFFGGGVFIR